MIAYVLAALAGALAADRAPRAVALPLKALPVALLIAFAAARIAAGDRSRLLVFVALGLAFSLAGDLAIELRFLLGLAAFLAAHVAYLVAMGPPAGRLLPYLPAAALLVAMLRLLWRRVPPEQRPAVAVYALAIALMLGRALERAAAAPDDAQALRLALGAAVFAASDTLLAVDRWVRRLPASQLLILATYYAGQGLIAAGAGIL